MRENALEVPGVRAVLLAVGVSHRNLSVLGEAREYDEMPRGREVAGPYAADDGVARL